MLLARRSGDVSAMPWKVRGTPLSWANCSVGVESCPTPLRRPAVRPDPTRPWYVRVLDSTGKVGFFEAGGRALEILYSKTPPSKMFGREERRTPPVFHLRSWRLGRRSPSAPWWNEDWVEDRHRHRSGPARNKERPSSWCTTSRQMPVVFLHLV